ncbi:uncharacterized protein LOC127263559 [Andrographis paniculata]|uniref:uncharacterized protein LOC127263559 n=1 Tax=Andrographis paniculata TaxID=175694 RepID=UPI0021E6D8BD|nr:uncharacterized protein LOC127263559 [Andrographis paniculata]
MQEISRDPTMIIGNSHNVFVTYKRKRLFSRSDLHSDNHPEISVAKSSTSFEKDENGVSEHTLQSKERDVEISHECSQRNAEEDVLLCEHCNSKNQCQCSEENASKLQKLNSVRSKQQDSFVSKCQNYEGKHCTFDANVALEVDYRETHLMESAAGSSADEKSFNPQTKPLLVKSGLEHKFEEKVSLTSSDASSFKESDLRCQKVSGGANCSHPMDSCVSETYTSKETNKGKGDCPGGSCNNSHTYGRFSASLITYQRRSKRKRNIAALEIVSETGISYKSVMALKDNEKPSDIDNLHVSAAPAPEIAMDPQKDVPSGTIRDIDCNLPLVSSFDESHLPRPSDFLPSSVGSGSKSNENSQTVETQCRDSNSQSVAAAVDKGKSVMESEPASGNISRNTYLQLFPENSNGDPPQLPNNQEKLRLGSQAWPGLVQLQPREPFHDFMAPTPDQGQSFARQRMMLARAARGNPSVLPTTFRTPRTNWTEAELDCLWIGVRRHGRGNWDAILRDRRLQFSPWKMPRDLADRWQEEQSRLFSQSQVRYANPIPNPFPPGHVSSLLLHPQANGNFPIDEFQLSLGNPYRAIPNRHLFHPTNAPKYSVAGNSSTLSPLGYFNPTEYSREYSKGALPHWLRDAAETPMGVVTPSLLHPGLQWPKLAAHGLAGRLSQQPAVDNRYASAERRNEARMNSPPVARRGRNADKPDGPIVILSDGSSEETISDDRRGGGGGSGGRPS